MSEAEIHLPEQVFAAPAPGLGALLGILAGAKTAESLRERLIPALEAHFGRAARR